MQGRVSPLDSLHAAGSEKSMLLDVLPGTDLNDAAKKEETQNDSWNPPKGRRFMTSSLYQCSPRSHCTWSMSLRFHKRKYGNLQLYCANAQEGASKAGATS